MRRDADIQQLWRQRSRLLDPDYGTAFHLTWKMLTYRTMNSGGRWRHFCLDSGATA